ncbi:MAG TPA: hypothetical protein VEG64_07110 [Candidatus Sulfotelmatobacter sp.]|nr:hypothetical protein [Candidatus Sulfotelmatobacter sp.]
MVASITAVFICWQAWETRRAAKAAADSVAAIQKQTSVLERQAEASEKAAEAAKDSADASVRIERAWVDVYVVQTGPAMYRIEVTNCGRTVAKIRNYSLAPKLSPVNFNIPEGREAYIFDRTIACSKYLVPNIAPWVITNLNLNLDLGTGEFDLVWQGKKRLSYVGVVRYDDISDQRHETEFCYYFDLSRGKSLVRVEAQEYNRHT